MSKKKYWWRDEPEIGSYDFCYNEAGDYDFYIKEAARYARAWSEAERKRRLKGAKFIWGGCSNGCSYEGLMKAETIEEAKKEFEAWYEQYLTGRIESLKKILETAEEEFERFMLYKKEG